MADTRLPSFGEGPVQDRPATRALVLHPTVRSEPSGSRPAEARLEEALRLAEAIGVDIVGGEVVTLAARRPGTLFGTGKVSELGARVAAEDVDLVVIDAPVTPVQQRNLERAWKAKVLDRTGLILEIFGERARTREGQLQVELAHLTYQKSRLVRSWTHLERQRGGLGFVGGPGETQIEADRRVLSERITKLKRQLETVARTRDLHRKSRREVPYPVVALVGYTNAGKSTLFNRLTEAAVMAKDMLFATLDPTMRLVRLPSGREIILSDTVGFISDLPTQLVAAFRATLEEVLEADLLLHVRDAASPAIDAEAADVRAVLAALGIDEGGERPMLDVMNKIDLMSPEDRTAVLSGLPRARTVAISAASGEGIEALLERIDERLAAGSEIVDLDIGAGEGSALAWLHAHAQVLGREARDDRVHLRVRFAPDALGRFEKRFGESARVLPRAAN